MSARRDDLLARLVAAGDPSRAEGQQAYMKSTVPFHGVRVPEVRRIATAVARDHPFTGRDEWTDEVLTLWRSATHREERYAAAHLAFVGPCRRWLDGDALPMIDEMIVTGAWWDHVDELAGRHLGLMLRQDPARVRPVVWRWATDDDLWRRRSAIICQLRSKDETDLELLTHAIAASTASPEFFLRKAIGWALRQHAKVDPDWVVAYVDRHVDDLSDLSRREALKNLG